MKMKHFNDGIVCVAELFVGSVIDAYDVEAWAIAQAKKFNLHILNIRSGSSFRFPSFYSPTIDVDPVFLEMLKRGYKSNVTQCTDGIKITNSRLEPASASLKNFINLLKTSRDTKKVYALYHPFGKQTVTEGE